MMRLKESPLKLIYITSPFGMRDYQGMWWHNGIDLRAEIGTPVYAVADGIVRHAKDGGSYGLYVTIDHNNWGSLYSHLQRFIVKVGDSVKAGDLIAVSGMSGVDVPHLHFELRQADYFKNFWDRNKFDSNVFMRCVDPQPYIENLIERKNLDKMKSIEVLKTEVKLADNTINFLDSYVWRESLIIKLAEAIK